jgi:hypothetical protein
MSNMVQLFKQGNVGDDFKLVAKEGFGWMNASIQVLQFKHRLEFTLCLRDWSGRLGL